MNNNKPLKILFLPKWYPNHSDILDGVFIVEHAKAINIFEDVFVLFVHSHPDLKKGRTISISNENGYKEIAIYFKSVNTPSKILNNILTGIRFLSAQFYGYHKISKEWGRPDITHVHVLMRTSVLAIFLKWFRGIPFIITEHFSGYDPVLANKMSAVRKKSLSFVLSQSAAITTVSESLKLNMQRINKNANYSVISNAIDKNVFHIRKKEKKDKKQLIHISHLSNEPKNFKTIIDVLKQVSELRNDFELHVVGGNAINLEKQKLYTEELGLLNNTIFFYGYLPKEQIAKIISQSDFMLMFSIYENQPCVLLESFMSGVPIISSDVGGIKEIVNPNNGVTIPLTDADILFKTILDFIDGTKKFNPSLIREDALKYSYEEVGKRFSLLYKSIV